MRAFFACYKPYLKTLIPLLFLALLATGVSLLLPLCIRYITDGTAQTAESLRSTGLFMLALVVFALLPPMLVFTVFFSTWMRRACARSYERIGEINAQAEDTLSGVRVLKAFAAEEAANERFAATNDAFFKSRKTIYGSESFVYQGSQ